MSNKYWQSELWGEHEDDVYAMRTSPEEFLLTVRVREFGPHNRSMLTQVFHPSGAKHSEHVFDVSDDSDEEAMQHGFNHGAWLAKGAKPR
ncbi:hypothetical protein [Pseudomonas azotoformans]|uniref:hypothetical protein n=1 Tax=Pseudomonas azotoformans TaxID=47878 RepID=UPI00122E68D2|nr:hypothetical protein [Pseudomonas azotoformans]UMY52022.1 hypothetical protein MLC69_13475 [Pseudomonas azotoformans]